MGRKPESQLLELQADRVEAVLGQHKAPGRVVGGTLGPRIVRFHFQPAPHVKYSQVEKLADDLALALAVPEVRLSREDGFVVMEFIRSDPKPVHFGQLLDEIMPMPLSTMLLGLTADGAPLLARLSAPEVAQVLVTGTTGAGKSILLRTMALSMAIAHNPRDMGMLVIDLKGRTFPVTWPHLMRPIVTKPDDVMEVLRSLIRLMERRDERGEHLPHVAVIIDELADLVMQVEHASDAITRLVQRGRQAGIHVIAATQHPAASILSSLMRANFPLRIVGKVVSAEDAKMASGRAGTNAHLLGGRGDFLAVSGETLRFQVPFVSEDVFAQEIKVKHPLRGVGAAIELEAAPEQAQPVIGTMSRAEADAEMLLARMTAEGRRWSSQNEAERWLCGYNGGGATSRTRAALALIEDADTKATTTTTTQIRPALPVFTGIGGVTA